MRRLKAFLKALLLVAAPLSAEQFSADDALPRPQRHPFSPLFGVFFFSCECPLSRSNSELQNFFFFQALEHLVLLVAPLHHGFERRGVGQPCLVSSTVVPLARTSG